MLTLFVFLAFIFGAAVGSFLGVLVDRLPRGEQILRGRSKCEHCHKILEARDLIPLFSYVLHKGHCRYCRSKIPIRVFLVELTGGIVASTLFLYSYFLGLSVLEFILLLAIFFSLIGIFFSDLIYGIIPDEFIATIIASSLFLLVSTPLPQNFITNVTTGLIVFIFFLAVFLTTRGRGMGFGDVKFAFVLGFFLGFPKVVIGLYAAFLTAAFVSIILILVGRKKLRGDTIVFGPFLVTGTVFAYFFGASVIELLLK